MKIYKGKLCDGGAGGQTIMVGRMVRTQHEDYPLPHIERHSPDGFNWGYGGSGPADTALSILTDCLGMEQANVLYQLFKWEFVAAWGNEFSISEAEIKGWARNQRAEIEL